MYPDISLHIDGAWTKAAGGKTSRCSIRRPGSRSARLPMPRSADLERALAAAQKGFRGVAQGFGARALQA